MNITDDINVDNLTIGEAKTLIAKANEVAGFLGQQPVESASDNEPDPLIGQRVIVRCRDAGVHFGTLVSIEGRTVIITNARRMWRWWSGGGEHTLSGVARHGLEDRSEVKIAGPVERIILPEACEVIQMSEAAASNVENYRVAQAD